MNRFLQLLSVLSLALLPLQAARAEWFEARTQHFTVYSDSTEADSKAFAERLERFDGALRQLQGLPLGQPIPETARVVVYRFGQTNDIGVLAGAPGVAGFYIPRAANPVLFTPVRDNRRFGSFEREDPRTALSAETVLQHEYTHHFMLRNFSAAYPRWYIEGFAELNATIELRDDGTFLVGKPANYRADVLKSLPQFSVKRMLDPKYKYDDPEDFAQLYATGWLLTHHLNLSPNRKGQLGAYLKAVGAGEDGMAAAQRIFGDLSKLDADLRKYLASNLPALEYVPANYRPPEVTVRKLDPAFAKVMRHRMKASRGQSRSEARGMNREMQAVASTETGNLDVQLLAAEAALDARDYPAATVAANRALALAPNSIEAMVFKARALFEPKTGTAARFGEARAMLAKAHAIDKTDPRPLIETYRAWRAQAVPVPEEAAIMLETAFPLASHDSEYRLLLTRQLLEENRIPQAEQVLAPLAYSYDGRDPTKYTPLVAMDRIKANDRAGALAKIQEDFDEAEKEDA